MARRKFPILATPFSTTSLDIFFPWVLVAAAAAKVRATSSALPGPLGGTGAGAAEACATGATESTTPPVVPPLLGADLPISSAAGASGDLEAAGFGIGWAGLAFALPAPRSA